MIPLLSMNLYSSSLNVEYEEPGPNGVMVKKTAEDYSEKWWQQMAAKTASYVDIFSGLMEIPGVKRVGVAVMRDGEDGARLPIIMAGSGLGGLKLKFPCQSFLTPGLLNLHMYKCM